MQLVPIATIPTNGPSGSALGAADKGAIVYVAGALNKLYVWDGAAWNACW
jgi:hypothetical protein